MPPEAMMLLPGMHGTGDLFGPFVNAAPASFAPVAIELPPMGAYDELALALEPRLPRDGRCVLVAESFSGPLAIRLADRHPDRVSALVLCNSFAAAPRPGVLRYLPWSLLFSVEPPAFVVRHVLVGEDAPSALVAAVRRAVSSTSVSVMTERVRAVLSVDDAATLRNLRQPVLDLRGTDDRLVPTRAADLVRSTRPDAVREDIPGPHLLLQARPAEAWRVIAAFCGRTRGTE